jgi:HJR/Mrr/RecB family endonuclease
MIVSMSLRSSSTPSGVEVIVQCKRHSLDHKVGRPIMKQLLTDTDVHKAARGLIVTRSYLTRGAHMLVDAYRHKLGSLDFDELTRLLKGKKTTNSVSHRMR